MAETKMVSTYLDQKTFEKLQRLATADRRSLSSVMELALLDYISQPAQVAKWKPQGKSVK